MVESIYREDIPESIKVGIHYKLCRYTREYKGGYTL